MLGLEKWRRELAAGECRQSRWGKVQVSQAEGTRHTEAGGGKVGEVERCSGHEGIWKLCFQRDLTQLGLNSSASFLSIFVGSHFQDAERELHTSTVLSAM